MDTKQCFSCKQQLALEDFQRDNRKYQVPADKGRCKVCINCEFRRAKETMSMFYFSREANDFVTVHFESQQDIVEAFKSKLDKPSRPRIFVTENDGLYRWDI